MYLSAIRCVMMDFASDRRGITALEYTLITVMVGGVLIASINSLGAALTNSYATLGAKLMSLAAATAAGS